MGNVVASMRTLLPGQASAAPWIASGDSYRVVVLGETGSGKTCFLDLLANLQNLLDAESSEDIEAMAPRVEDTGGGAWQPPYPQQPLPQAAGGKKKHQKKGGQGKQGGGPQPLKTVHREEHENKGARSDSQTNVASPYSVDIFGLHFTIIDTPGFGDTRGGREIDPKHAESIVEAIRAVEHVNCICLVVNGKNEKMTVQLKHVLDQVGSLLPKAILDQIVVVFTMTESHDDLLFQVDQFAEYLERPIPKQRTICLDNPLPQILKYPAGQIPAKKMRRFLETVDDLRGSIPQIFEVIASFPPVCTNAFSAVFEQKQQIERQSYALMEQYAKAISNEAKQAQLQKKLRDASSRKAAVAEFKKDPAPTLEWTREDTTKHNMICEFPGCKCNCHVGCDVPFSTDKRTYNKSGCGCEVFRWVPKEVTIRTETERSWLLHNNAIHSAVPASNIELNTSSGNECHWVMTNHETHARTEIDGVILGGQDWSVLYDAKSRADAQARLETWKKCPLPFSICPRVNDNELGHEQKCKKCGHEMKHHAHQRYIFKQVPVQGEPIINSAMKEQFDAAETEENECTSALESVKLTLQELAKKKEELAREMYHNVKRLENIAVGRSYASILRQQIEYFNTSIDALLSDPSVETDKVDGLREQIKLIEATLEGLEHMEFMD